MKVLLDHPSPFLLAHGGFQIQIEQTLAALRGVGVDTEYLRWWDEKQGGDIIHYFARPTLAYAQAAKAKGIKLVVGELLAGLGSRGPVLRGLQKALIGTVRSTFPGIGTRAFGWDTYQLADLCIALTPWEAHLMTYMFGADPGKVRVVPNGVEEVFLDSQPARRGQWLVCTAVITERKRVVELAEAAIRAQTPVWVIGKPYSEEDPYAQQFLRLARANPQWIRYEGGISDRIQLARAYREARGFVLLSTKESLSLSALEAAACECPLLLSDLPWARWTFQDKATYCPVTNAVSTTARALRDFYHRAPQSPAPPRPQSWIEIGKQLKEIYLSLYGTK